MTAKLQEGNSSSIISHKMKESKRILALSMIILILTAIIVVGATLIGVYMTQKYTEAVVQMALSGQNGEKVQQTVMVSDKENIALFYVKTNNESSTILYDYKQELITFRQMNSEKCYIMNINQTNAPKLKDILNDIKRFQATNTTRLNNINYNLLEGEEADNIKLGITVNILCSDSTIYWATMSKSEHLRWKIIIPFKIFGFQGSITLEIL
ncbi:pulmonary surfactant-associated protein C-like [Xenopus tropicalis]|uniref:Surfactant protein C n=1 Tax=Xenopus tropicalis TaxID=8364 RepID=A0A803JZ84_XENTR|nr:pulmonary surfactant-associated protein C-like [Xenopus tropicalis]